jgi:FemAB-related protein (PEP-CTERM system-associated)
MSIDVRTYEGRCLAAQLPRWEAYVARHAPLPLSRHPAWLRVLEKGLQQSPYGLEAVADGQTCGWLPLALVRSWMFGRFLVGLPYLNHGGVLADSEAAARALVDRAVGLAERLNVRYLELRQGRPMPHPTLVLRTGDKVNMGADLPATVGELWKRFPAKVRNQVRKGQKNGATVAWGRHELLDEFYDVFCRNLRDLGTPVYSRALFAGALTQFPDRTELAVARLGGRPAAAALLLHGWGVSEVPSAALLRACRPSNANMVLFWQLLGRAVERGQGRFDFGRSSRDSSTYRFKAQWGAVPEPADWQYYPRQGNLGDMRRDNPRYRRLIRLWQHLPVGLTRLLGPPIVRGIP